MIMSEFEIQPKAEEVTTEPSPPKRIEREEGERDATRSYHSSPSTSMRMPSRHLRRDYSDGEEVEYQALSSVELARDAKGVYRWTIKMYFDQGDDTLEPSSQIYELDQILRRQYL